MLSLTKTIFPLFAAALLTMPSLKAQTEQYSFQVAVKIGDSIDGSTITNFSEPPLLTDKGDLIFTAITSKGQAVFSSGKTLAKTGSVIDGKTLTSISSLAVNRLGTAAFIGGFAGGSGVFADGKLLVKTGDVINGQSVFNFYRGISINAKGDVSFEATTGTFVPNTTSIVFVPASEAPVLLASTGEVVGGKTLDGVGTPVVNMHGNVAFRGEFANNNDPNDTGVVLVTTRGDATPELLVETGGVIDGQTLSVFGFPAGVTNQSSVITTANFSGGSGLFRVARNNAVDPSDSHLLVSTGSVIGGQTLAQFGLVTTNRKGQAAFYGYFAGGQGIFTPSSLLVKTGDVVGSNTISAILFNSTAYNNNGTIAFTASFSDGSKAIVIGQPQQ